MLPYLGQGAAMAIEDGCVLAGAIARSADDLDAALTAYEKLRKPRASQAVLGSRARARENHLTSPLARWRRDLQYAWPSASAAIRPCFRPDGSTTMTPGGRWRKRNDCSNSGLPTRSLV
jgi:2-polyprenyl-6-methoxyphenol hydroxylase-like FAD-dependent oxidoreductase